MDVIITSLGKPMFLIAANSLQCRICIREFNQPPKGQPTMINSCKVRLHYQFLVANKAFFLRPLQYFLIVGVTFGSRIPKFHVATSLVEAAIPSTSRRRGQADRRRWVLNCWGLWRCVWRRGLSCHNWWCLSCWRRGVSCNGCSFCWCWWLSCCGCCFCNWCCCCWLSCRNCCCRCCWLSRRNCCWCCCWCCCWLSCCHCWCFGPWWKGLRRRNGRCFRRRRGWRSSRILRWWLQQLSLGPQLPP